MKTFSFCPLPFALSCAPFALICFLMSASACQSSPSLPATLDTAHEQCGYCRMIVSDQRVASQIVAPGEEPRFFDDLGCLANYLKTAQPPSGAVVYVADHRTKAWVRADQAAYTRAETTTAAMGSHFIAHESAESRDGDPDAKNGRPVDAAEVFAGKLPGGSR